MNYLYITNYLSSKTALTNSIFTLQLKYVIYSLLSCTDNKTVYSLIICAAYLFNFHSQYTH